MTITLTEQRPLRMDPEMSEAVESILKRYRGEKRKKAEAAAVKFYHSGVEGTFAELIEQLDAAVVAAVGG